MTHTHIKISGLGWVLPTGADSGSGLLDRAGSHLASGWRNDDLAQFRARDYLGSVKGYLDPAGGYCLAAAALALGDWRTTLSTEQPEAVGVVTITEYGAPQSAFRFYEQFLTKGARLASPLLFPHGYANTAGNLVSIEFGFGGPHLVLQAAADAREALRFATAQLSTGRATDMLVGACEAAHPDAVLAADRVLNGSVVVWLSVRPATPALRQVDAAALVPEAAAQGDHGAVWALLSILASLPPPA